MGALKLVSMYFNHPTIIIRATLISATTEAVAQLENPSPTTVEMVDVFHCVDAVTRDDQTTYITATQAPQSP